MVGIWLLVPEYLRLGTWDLLKAWTAMADERIEPRLALQLINESALCIIGIDPHRMKSSSKRQMVRRQKDRESGPEKVAQTFFALDAETKQPLCFTTASSARTTTQATPQLLTMSHSILKPNGYRPLVLADNEHYSAELFEWIGGEC